MDPLTYLLVVDARQTERLYNNQKSIQRTRDTITHKEFLLLYFVEVIRLLDLIFSQVS